MTLRARFDWWLDAEVGSGAVPALTQHLRDHNYRLYSKIEHLGRIQHDVYHPEHGFFHGAGNSDSEALRNVMKQIWLVTAFEESPERELGA